MSTYRVITLNGNDKDLAPYRNLILSTYLNSLRYGNEWFKLIDKDAYFPTYTQVIEMLLARPTSTVRLAVLTEDFDVCLGWSLSEDTKRILHYVFVKNEGGHGRKQGIATSLIPDNVETITHLTKIGASLWAAKLKNAKFNPFL